MTEYIVTHGKSCESLFLERGDDVLCREIREFLDTAEEFPREAVGLDQEEGEEVSVLSMAETLLRFLDALPESVIPSSVCEKVMRMNESSGYIMQVQSLQNKINNS
jgi:hypothetical protein